MEELGDYLLALLFLVGVFSLIFYRFNSCFRDDIIAFDEFCVNK